MAAIELTEAERDLLWQIWNLEHTSVGEEISGADCAEALDAAIGKAKPYVRLLRAIETGTLEPGDEAIALVCQHRTGTLSYLKEEHGRLFASELATAFDSELDEVAACDSILARTGGG